MSERTTHNPDKASNPYKGIPDGGPTYWQKKQQTEEQKLYDAITPREAGEYSAKLHDEYEKARVQALEFEAMAEWHADGLLAGYGGHNDIDQRPQIDVEVNDRFHTPLSGIKYHDKFRGLYPQPKLTKAELKEGRLYQEDIIAKTAFAGQVAKAILRRNLEDSGRLLDHNKKDGKLRQAAVAEAMLDGVEIKEESK